MNIVIVDVKHIIKIWMSYKTRQDFYDVVFIFISPLITRYNEFKASISRQMIVRLIRHRSNPRVLHSSNGLLNVAGIRSTLAWDKIFGFDNFFLSLDRNWLPISLIWFLKRQLYNDVFFVFFSFHSFRSDATQFFRASRRPPLGSVDSEDGNGFADDELQTLLPGTRDTPIDDLSQVRMRRTANKSQQNCTNL